MPAGGGHPPHQFKSLKRHLRTKYDLSPDDYRAKWGLAADYPMVAPNYAEARSNLAKAMGLGQQRRKTPPKTESKHGRKAAAK
jgi:predicted transcriptional regulator